MQLYEKEGTMVKEIILLIIVLCFLPIHANAEALVGWEKQIIGQQSNPIYLYVKDMDGDRSLWENLLLKINITSQRIKKMT